jgi:hypothetical protein
MARVTTEEEARARREIEGRAPTATKPRGTDAGAPEPSEELPPAGPHARSDLINPEATPGTGALTPPGGHEDVDSTSG